jgi:deoxyribodipyrimidine photolyase-related protein
LRFTPDDITRNVLTLVAGRFSNHFGDLEPFPFAVTRAQALQVLDHFIAYRLDRFGYYQDAMKQGEPWMFHSHLSFYLNCGLLTPLEVIRAVEKSSAPLNAREGFIRQILGWREFVRGLYWLKMPGYKGENFLNATRRLPWFYWSGDTRMNCLHQCVTETRQNAYAHHIQRLMVLGNFALIAGIRPEDVNEWFMVVYADAYEWVELPNVTGMTLYADGGILASKPYAAGGAYINRMSDYCKGCLYNVNEKTGPTACPFNYLYWDFMIRNYDVLHKNPRLGMAYNSLRKMTPEKLEDIKVSAENFFKTLEEA